MATTTRVLTAAVSGTVYTTNANGALEALDTCHSGATAPTDEVANGKLWLDTTTTPGILKIYNNATWEVVLTATGTSQVKLNGIEALADVTDVTNVTAAGALMDSEVTNLTQVKAFATTDYATAAQGTLAGTALQPTGNGSGLTNLTSANLTGALPAIDGSALTGVAPPTTAGAIGTYVWATLAASDVAAAQFIFGTTYAGTSLYPAGFASAAAVIATGVVKYSSGNSIGVVDTNVAALSGTWRCMGQTPIPSSTHDEQPVTMFVRIS